MKYSQVFEEKNGFIPNLSILDLIFCMGPQAAYYLENSYSLIFKQLPKLTMSEILNKNLQASRSQINQIVKELHDLCIEINHEELANTVSELRNRINEPFMFVIVGEVKAGKSSFINASAQYGKEICKVAPSPMTDTIQQVIYGEKEEEIQINEYLEKELLNRLRNFKRNSHR